MRRNHFYPLLLSLGLLAFPSFSQTSPPSSSSAASASAPATSRVLAPSLLHLARACQIKQGSSAEPFLQHLRDASPMQRGWKVLLENRGQASSAVISERISKMLGSPVKLVGLEDYSNKYTGETEKNLATVFNETESSDVVLFFDEADALFGGSSTVAPQANLAGILRRLLHYQGHMIVATKAPLRGSARAMVDRLFAAKLTPTADEAEIARALCWPRRTP